MEVLLTVETLDELHCTWTGLVHLEAKIQHWLLVTFFKRQYSERKKNIISKAKKQALTLHEQEGLNQIRNRQTEDPSNPIKRY